MTKENTIICIMCPLGCHVTVTVDDAGDILGMANHQCEQGEKYVMAEQKSPLRILTTTVWTIGASRPLLPVRSSKAMPKDKLIDAMHSLSKVRVVPPVRMAQVIVPNIVGTGVDMISTDELLE